MTVQDSGIGIAPEHLSKMFTRGFTTKTDGNGIGLHSSILAIQNMGGSMHVKSEGVGRGGHVYLDLPCSKRSGVVMTVEPLRCQWISLMVEELTIIDRPQLFPSFPGLLLKLIMKPHWQPEAGMPVEESEFALRNQLAQMEEVNQRFGAKPASATGN